MVSPKREYLRRRPETFGDFRLNLGKAGVQRRKRMREKPGFPAHSRVPSGAWPSAGMAGWRRSVDRASLQPDSLLTGNFTGKFAILVVQRPVQRPENATPQSWWPISDLDERSGDSAGRSFVQAQLALIRCPRMKCQPTASSRRSTLEWTLGGLLGGLVTTTQRRRAS